MSHEKFDDNCPGCKPAFLDLKTGQVLPDDHPVMQKVHAVWRTTTFQQREAFHDVMCLNSRDPLKLFLVKQITDQFK
jgi:hypothetical protein